jgi:hypothetical protein
MKQKGFALMVIPIVIAILIVLAIGVGYGAYQSSRPKPTSSPAISSPVPTTTPTLEVNFTETGNILNWDSQTESYTEDWTLLYEKPGNPAISVKLLFNEASLCNLGEGEKVCDKSELSNGDRAKVEGSRSNNKVVVIKLKKL